MKKATRARIFTFIYGFAKPHLPMMIFGTLLYASQTVMFPFINSVLMGGITVAIVNKSFAELLTASLQTLGMLALLLVMIYPGIMMYVVGELKTKRRMQVKLIRAFMESDTESRIHSGQRLSKLNTDVEYALSLSCDALAGVIFCLMPIITLSIAVFAMEWRVGLYTIFAGLVAMAGQVLFAKPLAKIAETKLAKIADAVRTLGDIFSGGVIARVFSLQDRMLTVFGRDNDEICRLIYREARVNGAQALVSGISSLLTTGGMFAVGSILISRGELTLPRLMAITALSSSIVMSISGIGIAWAGMQTPFEAGKRIYETLGGDNHVEPLREEKEPPLAESSKIELKDMTFSFVDAEKPLFHNVSLTVEENQFVAFVGESGCGKSTLLKVIAGIYEREGINLAIGGKRLKDIGFEGWRRHFAYVDQNCTLFNLTIAENIAIGREGASLEEVKAAAAKADADAFIIDLPLGYDTPVGEVGAMLSGGQRQRIAIARALIRHAPVLVLDEVTSALDDASEREVIETVNRLRGSHTILIVTHNPKSIDPDITLKVENGQVVTV